LTRLKRDQTDKQRIYSGIRLPNQGPIFGDEKSVDTRSVRSVHWTVGVIRLGKRELNGLARQVGRLVRRQAYRKIREQGPLFQALDARANGPS
jgi:hypothetical protein